MINEFQIVFAEIKFALIALIFSFFTISFRWKVIFNFLKLKSYNNIQRAHSDEVSRLGGLLVYIFMWISCLLYDNDNQLLLNLMISTIPFAIISVYEDLFHNTSQKIRLFGMLASCFIFFYINPVDFPKIDIPFFGDLINVSPVYYIFFTFSIMVIMNGMNFIDGMNGILGFTLLSQIIALILLSYISSDYEFIDILFIMSFSLAIFIFFNYPFGKVFAGDFGAYFYGFLIAMLVIIYFGKNDQLISWKAILLLFYPSMEVLFSFVRKWMSANGNPLDPDDLHLHTMIYKYLNKKKPQASNNSLVSLYLAPFIITPPITVIYLESLEEVLLCLLALMLIYVFYYQQFTRKIKS